MAQITNINRYIGLSTDTKPTADIPQGSTFLDADTGEWHIFQGTDWYPKVLLAKLTGSTIDLRGLAANRPVASSAYLGMTYWSVDTGAIEVCDGTTWRAV